MPNFLKKNRGKILKKGGQGNFKFFFSHFKPEKGKKKLSRGGGPKKIIWGGKENLFWQLLPKKKNLVGDFLGGGLYFFLVSKIKSGKFICQEKKVLVGGDQNPISAKYPKNLRTYFPFKKRKKFEKLGGVPPFFSFLGGAFFLMQIEFCQKGKIFLSKSV